MAQHDVVLILHLWGAVGIDVLPDELPDLRSSSLLPGSFAMMHICLLLCNLKAFSIMVVSHGDENKYSFAQKLQ